MYTYKLIVYMIPVCPLKILNNTYIPAVNVRVREQMYLIHVIDMFE